MDDNETPLSTIKEHHRLMPFHVVHRIMKKALPERARIDREATECMQECLSEFISFITSEASDHCQVEKRNKINGEDILMALENTGFENYSWVLRIYLDKFRMQARSEAPTPKPAPPTLRLAPMPLRPLEGAPEAYYQVTNS